MKKIALALVLTAVSGAAMAEWVALDGNDFVSVYVDPATIRRSGDMVKVWTLWNHKTPQPLSGGSYLSTKSQYEYDCKGERVRFLFVSGHAGNMGAGRVVDTDSLPTNWSPVAPGSLNQAAWEFACGKK